MADAIVIPREIAPSATTAARLTMALAAIVFLLMMVLGLVLRLAQSAWVDVAPDLFYQIMTAHGVGMVGTAGLAGAAIMWFFLNRHVEPRVGIYYLFLALSLLGVMFILGGLRGHGRSSSHCRLSRATFGVQVPHSPTSLDCCVSELAS